MRVVSVTLSTRMRKGVDMMARIRRFARFGYGLVSWLLVVGVAVQVFFAGYGILVKFGYWAPHVNLGQVLLWPLLVMILLSFLGRMETRTIWTSVGLLALYFLQYFLVKAPVQIGLPALRALHPVNALLIFYLACINAQRSLQTMRGEKL